MVRKIWNKDFILLMSSNFLMCVTYYSIISTLPIYLVSELRAGESEVGLVLAAYTIASVMVRPFGGFSLDKFGRRTVFLLSLLFYTIFFCGYLVATSISLLVLLRFVQGITWGVTTIAGSTIAVDIIPPEKRGEGIGYFGMSTTLGMSIGPVMGLFVYHHFGYMTVFVACIAVSIISLVCAGVIRLPQRNLSENLQLTLGNLFDRKAVVPSLNLLIIGFPLLVIFNNAAGFYTSALIIGFGIGVVFPVFQAIVNNLADPSRRGAANSTLYTALDIGMGAGMVMMGYVSQYISISATFLVSTVIIAAGLLVFRKFTAPYYKKQTAS